MFYPNANLGKMNITDNSVTSKIWQRHVHLCSFLLQGLWVLLLQGLIDLWAISGCNLHAASLQQWTV